MSASDTPSRTVRMVEPRPRAGWPDVRSVPGRTCRRCPEAGTPHRARGRPMRGSTSSTSAKSAANAPGAQSPPPCPSRVAAVRPSPPTFGRKRALNGPRSAPRVPPVRVTPQPSARPYGVLCAPRRLSGVTPWRESRSGSRRRCGSCTHRRGRNRSGRVLYSRRNAPAWIQQVLSRPCAARPRVA